MERYLYILADHSLSYIYGEKEKTGYDAMRLLDEYELPNKGKFIEILEKNDFDLTEIESVFNDWDFNNYFYRDGKNYDSGISFWGPMNINITLYEKLIEIDMPIAVKFTQWFNKEDLSVLVEPYTEFLHSFVKHIGGNKLLYHRELYGFIHINRRQLSIDDIVNDLRSKGIKRGGKRFCESEEFVDFDYFVEPVRIW